MNRIIAAAGLLVTASAAQASFVTMDAVGSGMTTLAIPGSNDFRSMLAQTGVSDYTLGTSLGVDAAGTVTYYYYGKEAGYDNAFTAGALAYSTQHTPTLQNAFGAPVGIGSVAVSQGVLDFNFCTHVPAMGPAMATAGCLGNARNDMFDAGSLQSIGMHVSGATAWLFWDDSGAGVDNDHDDMLVKAVFTPDASVPEPGSLALMGLGLIALAFRARVRGGQITGAGRLV